jgi:hypothetical protein
MLSPQSLGPASASSGSTNKLVYGQKGRPPSPTAEVFGPGAGGGGTTYAEREFYLKATLISEHDYLHPGTLPERRQDTFIGGRYKIYQLKEDVILYRGGSSGISLGEFFSFEAPISELQMRIDKAVRPIWPSGATSVVNKGYVIKIPKGTIVCVGEVAPQGGLFLGGTKQVFVKEPWLIPGIKVFKDYTLKEELLWNHMAMNK